MNLLTLTRSELEQCFLNTRLDHVEVSETNCKMVLIDDLTYLTQARVVELVIEGNFHCDAENCRKAIQAEARVIGIVKEGGKIVLKLNTDYFPHIILKCPSGLTSSSH